MTPLPSLRRALAALSALLAVALSAGPASAAPPTDLKVTAPENGSGLFLSLEWTPADDDGAGTTGYAVVRGQMDRDYELVAVLDPGTSSFMDKVVEDPSHTPPADTYDYRVLSLNRRVPARPGADAPADAVGRYMAELFDAAEGTPSVRGETDASVLRTSLGHMMMLAIILAVGAMMYFFTDQARRGKDIFIRRIPGIDAIEEGIGRATEMGKPVLYVPGIDELQDIQTIASVLILGQVAETVAEYQSDIIVSCCIPIVREVADEVVRAGYYQAGYPDAYNPANTRFISSEQFAFCAGTNGIMLREKPATNIYLGRFFAESLILAETGFINRSIQIAGTAEATQLPFFIAACDYTLIGEELFAVSAYLSKDPRLVSSLKASDWVKILVVASLILGTLAATAGSSLLVDLYTIVGE
jgi:hypothetical protein